MGMTERWHKEEGFTRAQKLERQNELRKKIQAIQLFPGNLEEFAKLKGGEYELIKLPGKKQFLEGGLLEWKGVDDDELFTERLAALLSGRRKFYSEIQAKAVELGADALIYYTQEYGQFGGYRETGVPIKRVN